MKNHIKNSKPHQTARNKWNKCDNTVEQKEHMKKHFYLKNGVPMSAV